MQAAEQLWRVYEAWRILTEQEGAAIQDFQWSEVQKAQDQKKSLQTEILRLTDQAKASLESAAQQASFDQRLRQIVNELILLETQNNLKVEVCLAAAESEKCSLEATSNRLRLVHSRYVPARGPVWQNLS